LLDVVTGAINIMQERLTRSRMAGDPPDILLEPRLAHIGLLEFDRAEEAIEEGRDCAQRASGALTELLEPGGESSGPP
ncbi:MAG: patatin, partial [Proteobacteria bacterium]|nr:patatin [Pseudomonadota bacterium]